MSSAEVLVWTRLRGRNPQRPTFRRQHPVGNVILDFYCPSARLAVEIDGSAHWTDDAQVRDLARDQRLAAQGISVLRIAASDVYRDLDGVADAIILRALERRRQLTT
jgi:very-short-patch-repair endonuclease